MQRVTNWLEERRETRKYRKHPANPPAQRNPLPQHNPLEPANQQPLLHAAPRQSLYGWLFGHRSLHYFNWWNESAQRWRTLQHTWFCLRNIIVNDTCPYVRDPANVENHRPAEEGCDTWMDLALMPTWSAGGTSRPYRSSTRATSSASTRR
ncbi:hypothetical protein BP00DRAFT_424889 [Aspergillus indologenus CBS 114.80]|uniref:Uncharacterized protein n=1 Tax=Aspergillus indologenus CBS 114.80 TaxID=1450541 RepID=A0A2V5I755_9EURO|nr:hypothetical protein BP00DRAFT_424889 [Aspergillus indologenus CBS 114.80]